MQHARIEGKPRLQRVGSNLTQLEVSVMLHASFCNPEIEAAQLDQLREDAQVLPLILGNGAYVGDFVIQSIERGVAVSDRRGNVVSQTLSMSLLENYTADAQARLKIRARQAAFATDQSGVAPLRVVRSQPPTLAQSVSLEVSAARLAGVTVDKSVIDASRFPSRQPHLSEKIARGLSSIEQAVQSIQTKILNPALAAYEGEIASSAEQVFIAVQNFRAVLPISGNLGSISTANGQLLSTLEGLKGGASGLSNAVITRRI